MPRSSFIEREFTCAICGARFKALAGPSTPYIVYCGDCGLRYPREKLDQMRKAGNHRK